ncbi:MAG: SwmB domain-containing protein, partial [Rhodococcus sp.]|nr:SwmB domain-containing protein [Rhodococcus sp. (in: high G+C Gram-positive bacteria)]
TAFRALGITLPVQARDHATTSTTDSDPGVPIFWLAGDQVADDYNDFYDGSWDSNDPRDELGKGVVAQAEVFTGSNSDGTRFPRRYFGTVDGNAVRVGIPQTPGLELDGGRNRQKDDEYLIYGLSTVFTVSATTVPTAVAAAVDGVTLRMRFTEPLDPSNVPAAGDFSVNEGGVSRSVTSVSIDGTTVTLTLSSAVVFGQAVTVTYTPGTTPLRNPAGTVVEAITARTVTNSTLPVLSIAQAATSEGGSLEFTVTLMTASDVRVTVDYATSDGTATEGKDFSSVSGTLAFAAGDTEATITVDTEADEFDEGSETFPMTLANPINATLEGGLRRLQAAGTILDDDEPQAVAVPVGWPLAPSELALGDSFRLLFLSSSTRHGRTHAIGPYDTHVRAAVRAGHANVQSYRAHFRALASTAAVDARDHTGTSHSASVTGVPIFWLAGDQVADDYSDFYDGTWDSNAARDESGSAVAAGTDAFTGSYSAGTRVVDQSLGAEGGAVRIGKAGTSGRELDGGTTRPVADEVAVYGLSGVFTITAGMLPELSVSEGTATEGGAVEFTVTLSPPSAVPVTVLYETSSGTAVQGDDFEAASGGLQFAANDTQETVEIATLQDRSVEGSETFSLTLSGALNAGLSGGGSTLTAAGTIADDDIRPVLSMATVDGAMLTLAYSDPLDPRSVPVPGDFDISVDGMARPVWRVIVGGSTLTLTLESAGTHGQAVSASYVPGMIPIQHTGGTDAEAFTGTPVTNSTPAATS